MFDIERIYVDFDGVICNTIATICKLYNDDYKYYQGFHLVNWMDVTSYDFKQLTYASKHEIDRYFTQPRFFDNIILMNDVKYAIGELSRNYEIVIVSIGNPENLVGKELWVKNIFPFAKFQGIDMSAHKTKSHINMADGLLIDDNSENLTTSNAMIKLCFGRTYDHNTNWHGLWLTNWLEVLHFLQGEE